MASVTSLQLFKSASKTKVTPTTEKKTLGGKDKNFIGFLKVSGYTNGTFTCKILHSPNNVDWFDLVAFTALSAAGSEIKQVDSTNTHVMTYVKAEIIVTGAPATGAFVEMDLLFNQ